MNKPIPTSPEQWVNAGTETGAREERQRVVKWLRRLGESPPMPPHMLADAIEAWEHVKDRESGTE